jgi:hypothetical protein
MVDDEHTLSAFVAEGPLLDDDMDMNVEWEEEDGEEEGKAEDIEDTAAMVRKLSIVA